MYEPFYLLLNVKLGVIRVGLNCDIMDRPSFRQPAYRSMLLFVYLYV